MPKEKLNHERTEKRTNGGLPGDPVWDELVPTFSIHWQADNYMQIGVKLDVAQLIRLADEAKATPEQSYIEVFSGLLDRGEAQMSIRALKRARNQVFGADE